MRVALEDRRTLRNVRRDVAKFRQSNRRIQAQAAAFSTGVSRDTFRRKLSGRPSIPSRPGRPSTMGSFARLIRWQAENHDGIDFVQFQIAILEQDAPYWLVQELGTGESGRILDDSLSGASYKGTQRGAAKIQSQIKGGQRPEGGSGVVSVKSQRGRMISRYLTWAQAAGNPNQRNYTFDVNISRGAGPQHGTQQLMYYKDVRNAPLKMDLDPMRIKKEIEGKHFIRDGGRAGLGFYRDSLMTLAQQTFAKR